MEASDAMRTYYYASERIERYDSPQNIVPDCSVTMEMLRQIIEDNAQGHPPFTIFVPSDLAWSFVGALPKGIFNVEIQKNDSPDAVGEIVIYFSYEHSVSLFYRRQRTVVIKQCGEESLDDMELRAAKLSAF